MELHEEEVVVEVHEGEVERRIEEVLVCAVGRRPAGGPRRAGGIRSRGQSPLPRVASLRPGTALAGERERRPVGTPTRATMAAVILVPLRDTVHRPRPLSPTSGPRRRRPAGALAPREEWHPSSVATRLSPYGRRAARTRALPSTAETTHARPPPCSRAATAAAALSTPSGPIRATVCGLPAAGTRGPRCTAR